MLFVFFAFSRQKQLQYLYEIRPQNASLIFFPSSLLLNSAALLLLLLLLLAISSPSLPMCWSRSERESESQALKIHKSTRDFSNGTFVLPPPPWGGKINLFFFMFWCVLWWANERGERQKHQHVSQSEQATKNRLFRQSRHYAFYISPGLSQTPFFLHIPYKKMCWAANGSLNATKKTKGDTKHHLHLYKKSPEDIFFILVLYGTFVSPPLLGSPFPLTWHHGLMLALPYSSSTVGYCEAAEAEEEDPMIEARRHSSSSPPLLPNEHLRKNICDKFVRPVRKPLLTFLRVFLPHLSFFSPPEKKWPLMGRKFLVGLVVLFPSPPRPLSRIDASSRFVPRRRSCSKRHARASEKHMNPRTEPTVHGRGGGIRLSTGLASHHKNEKNNMLLLSCTCVYVLEYLPSSDFFRQLPHW